MPEWISRTLVALLALPAAYLTLWFLFLFGLTVASAGSEGLSQSLLALALLTVAFAALIAGWTLLARFVVRGIVGLCQAKVWLWWLAIGGGVLSIICAAAFRIDAVAVARFNSGFVWTAQFIQYGVLFLIPLGHLALERVIRGRKLTMRWSGP